MIHPDTGNRFKLTGYASAAVWIPGDLRALGVHVKGGKVWGLTKARALEIGQQIEDAMLKADSGERLNSIKGEPEEKPASPAKAQTPQKPARATDSKQATFL